MIFPIVYAVGFLAWYGVNIRYVLINPRRCFSVVMESLLWPACIWPAVALVAWAVWDWAVDRYVRGSK